MAQGYATFTVNSADPVNTVYTVAHGLANVPQIVLAVMSGQSSTGAPVEQRYQKSFGCAVKPFGASAVTMLGTGAHSDDAVALTQSDVSFRNDCILCEIPGGANQTVTNGKLTLDSVDGTNLNFKMTEVFLTSSLVRIWYFGGPDLTFVELGQFQAPIVTGQQSYANAGGFKPDVVLFFGDHLSQALPFVQPDTPTHLGVVDSSGNQWTWAGGENTQGGGGAGGSGRATTYMLGGQCVAIMNNNAANINSQANWVSMDSGGFTLNWNQINLDSGQTTGRRFAALQIQGGLWQAGTFSTFTDTSLHTISNTLPFTPEGILFSSANKPASTNITVDLQSENWSLGFVSGSTNGCAYSGQKGTPWTPSTVVFTDQDSTFCYLNVSNAVTRQGTAKATLVANGFQWQHTTADVQANLVGYLAYATQQLAATRTTVIKTVKPKGGGDYLSLNAALAGEIPNHKNMVLQNIILEFDCYDGIDTVAPTVHGVNSNGGVGYITSPTNYVFINAVKGHSGFFDPSGNTYLLDLAMDNNANGFVVQCEYVRMKQLQLRCNMATGGSTGNTGGYMVGATGMVAPTFIVYENCIAQANFPQGLVSYCNGFKAPPATFTGCTVVYVNCVTFDFVNQDSQVTSFNNANSTLQNIYYYNCGAYTAQAGFQDHSDVININCVALGCDFGWLKTAGRNAASDYNFSTCGPFETNGTFDPRTTTPGGNLDVSGPHSNAGYPVYVKNPNGNDFTPTAADTAILGTGKDLSGDPIFPFNFDITGAIRPSGAWSRGPYQGPPVSSVPQTCWWTWVNATTSASAIIKAKMTQPSLALFLEYCTAPDFQSAPLGSIATATSQPFGGANIIAQWNLVQLAPNTRYYYRIIDSLGNTFYPTGLTQLSFLTFPVENQPANFSFGVGACSNTGANTRLYDTLLTLGLQFYMTNGEWHYYNINQGNARQAHELGLDTVLTGAKRARMWATMAHDYIYDDHDVGIGNTDSTTPSLADAGNNYRANCPSYFLPDVGPTTSGVPAAYHSFLCGRVRVVVVDDRMYRDPNANNDSPTHYLIGPQQLAWLKSELLTAKQQNQFAFIVSTVDWIGLPGDNGSSEWPAFGFEQRRVADYIQSIGLTAVAITTGDMHSVAIDSGAHDLTTTDGKGNHMVVYNPFPEHQNNAVWGIPYDLIGGINNPSFHAGSQLMGRAGVVGIADDGQNMTVTYNVYNELGLVFTYSKVYALPPSPNTGQPGGGGNPRASVRQIGYRVQTEGDVMEEMDRRIEGVNRPGRR